MKKFQDYVREGMRARLLDRLPKAEEATGLQAGPVSQEELKKRFDEAIEGVKLARAALKKAQEEAKARREEWLAVVMRDTRKHVNR